MGVRRVKRSRVDRIEMASDAAGDASYLSLVISSSLSSFGSQKRFPASITIGELKVRAYPF